MKVLQWIAVACGVFASASVAQASDSAEGKQIFSQVCSHCHNTTSQEKIGPGLAGVTERRSVEWIDAWLKNPGELIKTDAYAKSLRDSNKYGMTMPAIPEMKNDEMRASIIAFLKSLG